MFYRSFLFLPLSSLLIGVVLLTGCGGGGGGACTPIAGFRTCTDQSSTDASSQYDLSTLLAKVHQSSRTDTFSVIGSCTGTAEINRGTLLDITRNNTAQYAQSESATLTFTEDSSCANALKGYSNESVSYYTTGKKVIDVVTNSTSLTLPLYREITAQSDLPTSASIGNNGAYRTWQSYADSTKTTAKGRIVETYELAQDGASTPSVSALLYIKSIETDAGGQTLSTEKKSYRITPNGNIAAINWEIVYPSLVNPPLAPTEKYSLQAFYENWITNNQSFNYSVTGTCSGSARLIKGRLIEEAASRSVYSGEFSFSRESNTQKCRFDKTFTINVNPSNSFKPTTESWQRIFAYPSITSTNSFGVDFYGSYDKQDLTYIPSTTNDWPTEAKLGDSGLLTEYDYSGTSTPSETKNKSIDGVTSQKSGKIKYSYKVEKDGNASATTSVILLLHTYEYSNTNKLIYTIQNRIRLKPDGSYIPIEQQIINLDSANPYFLILTAQ